jgi:hypothetical protein
MEGGALVRWVGMVREELALLYDNYFTSDKVVSWGEIPLQDEPFVQAWEEYIRDIPRLGVPAALSQRLVQLRFPVMAGMSTNPNYQAATRKGLSTAAMKDATGAKLENPAGLKVYLYQTMAGRIPVIETGSRDDFETLVRVFSRRNEPAAIPSSMGACMIKGYNNWDRVAKYKQECGEHFDFNQMKAHKELYQDTFLILTDAGYSGIPAYMLGLAEDEWRKLSLVIRIEHEATHYFTLRFLGSARNHLLDEFIADYMGIVAAIGRYRADWFLCFMGLEHYPAFRAGGRLTNYLKDIELSQEAFDDLKSCIKNAAENVEKFASTYQDVYSAKGKYEMLLRLSKSNLIALASPEAGKLLISKE